ncbi:arginine transporter [Pseudoroseicyclus tamaricis]|nr:arginine transporter [Pseudoroseicyclus tamaricis]
MTALVACGPRLTGEVSEACMAGGRSAANPALCSCVQQVANQTLSGSDRRRAATFFEDPHLAQEARTADTPAMEAFWTRYRAFADTAERVCG